MRRIQVFFTLLLLSTACLGDPAGPGVLNISVLGAEVDTLWVGAPGEALPTAVRLKITDDAGRALPAATIEWEVVGRNAQVLTPTLQSSAAGVATAGWQLGTDAAEEQQLRVTVRWGRKDNQIVIRARAVPHIVEQVRVAIDTPAVVRLGDTLAVRVAAIDPYGNEFPAPDLALYTTDTTLATIAGTSVVGATRRGVTQIRATAGGISAMFSLHVRQYVAAIEPVIDVLQFTALGAELPVAYVVRDDRGRVVADTTVAIEAANPAITQVVDGVARAVAPGVTSLRLSLGPASATMLAGVQQRIGSLRLLRDTIRLTALMDTTTVVPYAHDSLGSEVPNPSLAYDVSDRAVARLAGERTLEALRPGAALLTVRDSLTGVSTSANVVVQQVVTSIAVNPATIVFDALGDSMSVGAVAHDRLGSVVAGATFEYSVSDTAVVTVDSLNQLHAVAPGQTTISARDPETGTIGARSVLVDQVATQLTVQVTYESPIISLAAGDTLPLSCYAVDRNGYQVARQTSLVGSVKGTVAGSGCGDVVVQHSGYDTLVFAMNGAQARVPVIVAARPDSVGVVTAAQPLTDVTRLRFKGEDLGSPSTLALRPLVAEILAAYGNPTSNLERARALRDWVARTAIYPDVWVRPGHTTSNLSVLPVGKTWSDVNEVISPEEWYEDNLFWGDQNWDGYTMLDRLLGTLDQSTGRRAEDGMMEYVGGARYRIRDIESYHYTACTYQAIILNALWGAAGLHGMLASVLDHDPSAVFIPELGRWVYEDATFNEDYLLDGQGEPLSPTDLLAVSTAGEAGRLHPAKIPGPNFDPPVYMTLRTYRDAGHPEGMIIMGSGLSKLRDRFVQIDVPALASVPAPWSDPNRFARATASEAFPTLGPVVNDVRMEDSVFVVQLSSTFPYHHHYERRLAGQSWESVGDSDVLPVGATKVEYRSVDAVGNISASAVLDVWAPRTDSFVQSAVPGSLRAQARYLISP